jgi:di/tricarboxylate transporter
MTLAAGYVLALMLVALALFAIDFLRVDVVALIVLLALTIPRRWIPGLLTADEAIAGFGSDTIMVLIALFILTAGVIKTGVVERLGLRLASLGSTRPVAFARFIILAASVVSAFVSNTLTTAVFLPLAVGASGRAKIPASKVLMPLAFASILTGTMTVIGTSTNLVVSGQMDQYGMAPLGFFEMAPVGGAIAIVGLLYLLFVAPRLIPDRGAAEKASPQDGRKFRSEIVLSKKSPLAGKTLAQLRLGDVMSLIVVSVRRSTQLILKAWPTAELREGDELVIEGRAQDILSVKDMAGIDIKPEAKLSGDMPRGDGTRIVEAMVLPRSPLIGQSLRNARFHKTTGVTVLALHSAREHGTVEKLSTWRLRSSDVLLLQGTSEDLARLPNDSLLLLEDFSAHHPRTFKGTTAAAIFIGSMVLGATGVLSLPIAFLLGVLALVLTNCLTADEAYAAVDWRLLVMIGAMMAFGTAMEKSGASAWLANLIVLHVSPFGGYAVMAAFFLLTMVLSQPMSNQAAALIVLPVAVHTAQSLGIDPRSIVITVTLAASCSFMTPLEPSCLLVYGPGRYRFFDFMRAGFPLTVIAFVIAMILVPVFWPLGAAAH